MIVHQLCSAPPKSLSQALADFEQQFTYPLGPGRLFRISHGDDYSRFFRAIGKAACFVAEEDGLVVGTLGVALRTLRLPNGVDVTTAYFADLKIAPNAYRGRVILQLFKAAKGFTLPAATVAYGIVMDGTRMTPPRYTGRLEIPLFAKLGQITVLRLSTCGQIDPEAQQNAVVTSVGTREYARLLQGRQVASLGGNPKERSEATPQWLTQDFACGRLEDTRRAKRLIDTDGNEMVSAHLSSFAYRDAKSAAALLKTALARANTLGFPSLFVAVDAAGTAEILRELPGIEAVSAPATIYGAGLPTNLSWNINTAEI
jgi:hypothetical protein